MIRDTFSSNQKNAFEWRGVTNSFYRYYYFCFADSAVAFSVVQLSEIYKQFYNILI